MIRIELPVLVERLNPICRHMLEEAAALCVNHQGAEIRIEHLLLKMLETPSAMYARSSNGLKLRLKS